MLYYVRLGTSLSPFENHKHQHGSVTAEAAQMDGWNIRHEKGENKQIYYVIYDNVVNITREQIKESTNKIPHTSWLARPTYPRILVRRDDVTLSRCLCCRSQPASVLQRSGEDSGGATATMGPVEVNSKKFSSKTCSGSFRFTPARSWCDFRLFPALCGVRPVFIQKRLQALACVLWRS